MFVNSSQLAFLYIDWEIALFVINKPIKGRKKYNRFLQNLHTEASIAETVTIEQEEKMEEKLKEEKRKWAIETANSLIKFGLSNEQIASTTGLTVKAIQKLRGEINHSE